MFCFLLKNVPNDDIEIVRSRCQVSEMETDAINKQDPLFQIIETLISDINITCSISICIVSRSKKEFKCSIVPRKERILTLHNYSIPSN